ncbi:MAG TPA: hypothetical protein VKX45_01590 [Bryobacteraceae bacterium]|jgi:hypothetical protein|nr:hypothetical protein [Bryobacteraceae bacterium]
MRIRWKLGRAWKRLHAGMLSSRLERMAAHAGPAAFGTPEFLEAEMKLGQALAVLAGMEYRLGNLGGGGLAHARAEQIHTALARFLPHAELSAPERTAMERRLERLQEAILRISGEPMAA